MATPSTVLDISPYNNLITLTCTVTTNPIITHITYQWAGNSVSSANSATVTVFGSTPGQYPYQCSATVTVGQLSTVTIASNTVTVRGKQQHCTIHKDSSVVGPAPPNVPVNVSTVSTISNVSITFTITSVTYTPETYSVRYGITASNLNLTSSNTATSVGVDSVQLSPIPSLYIVIGTRLLSSGIGTVATDELVFNTASNLNLTSSNTATSVGVMVTGDADIAVETTIDTWVELDLNRGVLMTSVVAYFYSHCVTEWYWNWPTVTMATGVCC